MLLWSFHIRNVGVDGLKDISKSSEQTPAFIKDILKKLNAKECFYLATCNRVEFLITADEGISLHKAKPFFTDLKPKTFTKIDDISTHLLEVACSLDSVVFGENQILGQIKSAFTEQQKQKLIGPRISKILNLILREAKKIRTETQLSRLQTSISSVAGKMIHQTLKNKASVLLVGYGETHKLLHKYLEKKNFRNITITNRTALVPESVGCKVLPWSQFLNADLRNYEVVSFATASQEIIMTKAILDAIQPKMVVDLCVPPNADAKMVQNAEANYVGLDQLQKILSKDKKEATLLKKQLKGHISESVVRILSDLSIQSIYSLITGNIQKSIQIHEESLTSESEKFFETLTLEQKLGLTQWSEKLIKKINHIHLKTYKEVVNALQTQSRNSQK